MPTGSAPFIGADPGPGPSRRLTMRMLLHVHLPAKQFNRAVQDGTAGSKLHRILEETKPEAVYFTEQNGERSALCVVDLANPSQIPALAEPWYLLFRARVEFRVAMTPEDLGASNLDEMGKKWE
jgi:hypothetical protein